MKKLGIILLTVMCSGVYAQSHDSVKVAASGKYDDASLFKKFFLGTNYRSEWSTPVTMPVFRLDKEKGGLKIVELGGGMQTKSLELKDAEGNVWALRTVDKEVEKALPPALRKTFVRRLVQDMISASHPYAALTIPELAKAVGVKTGSQQLFFVPDDPAFGEFREIFANTVCLLEQRSLPMLSNDSLETEDVIENIMNANNNQLNQKNILKARLLDMLIADWDRHAGQWKWSAYNTSNITIYEPLPRDRDQAYFNSNGFLVRLITAFHMPHMKGFKKDPDDLEKLNIKSWSFDKNLLNELDRVAWENTVKEFQRDITDTVIHKAVMNLPREIYYISGSELEMKLRSRRDQLLENVMDYYEFLAESVEILGSDEPEYFNIVASDDKIAVTVLADENQPDKKIYHRVFDKDETNRIFLNGLGDKDHYKIEGKVTGIKLILDSGDGQDAIDLGGNPRIKLRDLR